MIKKVTKDGRVIYKKNKKNGFRLFLRVFVIIFFIVALFVVFSL